MPALNLDLDYFTHPKIMRLAGILGPYALALPIRLWCHVAKHHCETGTLEGYTKYEVESVSGWTGAPGDFVDAMLKINLLEQIQNGYQIHDWLDHAGHFREYKKRAKSAAKKRWKRHATSIAKPRPKQCSGSAVSGSAVQSIEEEESRPAAPPPKKAIRGTVYPEDFQFDARGEALAQAYGLNPHKEQAAFRDHHVSKGTVFKDWQAAYRTWLRKSLNFSKRGVS